MRTRSIKSTSCYLGVIAVCLLLGRPVVRGDSELNIDDLVAKHLESVGSPEARAAVKSRVAQGTVAFNERISGSVHLDGTAVVSSAGPKFKGLGVPNAAYTTRSPRSLQIGLKFVFSEGVRKPETSCSATCSQNHHKEH
jgi:hypothetical protein